MSVLVVVCGHPATGKSTLAAQLAKELGMPVLAKDAVKEALADVLGCEDRAASKRLGEAANTVLVVHARALLEAGRDVIAESNFSAELASGPLRSALNDTGSTAVRVVLRSDASTAVQRYEERAKAGGRHPCHFDLELLPELAVRFETPYQPPELPGPIVEGTIEDDLVPAVRDALASLDR